MQEKTVEIGGKAISYRTTGEGPSLVLLHGFGEDNRIWTGIASSIKGYSILMPNLPGTGNSDAIDDMSMEGLADAVYNLLQQLKITRCVLIGHSMGGYIALAFWERHPEMLTGLGLFHSSAYADSDEKKAIREKGIDFITKNGGAKFLETSIPGMFSPSVKEQKPNLVEEHLAQLPQVSDKALIAYYRGMMARPDRTHLLPHNKIPLLFVLGAADTAVPLADGLAQAHLPQAVQVHLLQQSGHMGMLEEPEQSVNLLQDYLATT